ncbi:TAXI family TRAP transporter solute-binding subunit [Micromonospora echinospora]|uniref:TAXI family TRAP transporter solute-binding subunit n=1 Tax=Micromonospora echinospora TaxID=1877 RepID=UPI003A86B3EF
MTRRRTVLAAPFLVALLGGGCSEDRSAGDDDAWHGGRIFLATGNTTGVYYQLGGGYADIISRHLPGYEARAEPTGASGDNIPRVVSGDMEIGFSSADTAADAIAGRGAFQAGPQQVQALARIYSDYIQVVVRSDAEIETMDDLRGKRVSTGSPRSGTDAIATRLLTAAGLHPEHGVERERFSLPETVKRMRSGTLDAFFFSGGLPTPGIADLVTGAPDTFAFLPIANLVGALTSAHGPVYTSAVLPRAAYGTRRDVPTVTVPNLLLVNPAMPEKLAYDLTRLLFAHQTELARVHPEGRNIDRTTAGDTEPIPLHPGAARFHRGG